MHLHRNNMDLPLELDETVLIADRVQAEGADMIKDARAIWRC